MTEVWIISNTSEKTYNNEQIKSELVKRNVSCKVIQFNLLTLFDEILFYKNNLIKNVEKLSSNPDLVIFTNSIQINETMQTQCKLVLNKLISMKPQTIFVNDIESHITASSKHNVYEILQETDIPMPKTKISYNWNISDNFIEQILIEFSLPLVIKSTDGYGGEGIDLCKSRDELKANLEARMIDVIGNKKPIIFQEYMNQSAGLMIGVRATGSKIDARYMLGSPIKDEAFKSDISPGKLQFACEVDDKLREIVTKTMLALELDTARLDIFPTIDGYKICEVNCAGNFYGLDVTNNLNQAADIIDLAFSKLEG